MNHARTAAIITLSAASAPALAQSTGFVWAENAGWINFDAANGIAQGPVFHLNAITGYAWGENIGWVDLGSNTSPPAPASQTGTNYGVGIDADGYLYGYAWSENAGWINFGPLSGVTTIDTPNGPIDAQPRMRRGRLFGAAWSEGLGWINLSIEDPLNPEKGAGLACPPDVDRNGILNFFDQSTFLAMYNTGNMRTDWDDTGTLNFFDVSEYLASFTAGCP